MIEQVLTSVDARKAQTLADLAEFLRIPSVSTKPEHSADVRRCAEWLTGRLAEVGVAASVEETGGHPVVLGRGRGPAAGPTVLLYGHYDVQPVEPLDLWTSPPFEPMVRDGAIYARGAADDKGQVWAHVEAIRAWQSHGGLPVNLIVLIEGEEEIGSENLEAFIARRKKDLKADIAVISDTEQFARGTPAITYGLRGLAYLEVFVTGPSHDLHSGLWGGAAVNPANVLCELLATLHDADGRVNVEGFYDDVRPLSDQERRMWAKLPVDERQMAAEIGVAGLSGEKGYTALERMWARPTCDVNGLSGGYQGPGAKTVIPSVASAKVSMRLVPDQDPQKIAEAFETALRNRAPANVKLEFRRHGLARPAITPIDSPAMKLAAKAVEQGFGQAPVLIRGGGTIPVVQTIKSVLGMDTLLVGFGLPDDRVHSPNEKFDLESLYCGTRTLAALYGELGQM